jgi:phosphonate transport system substrate-binding protein
MMKLLKVTSIQAPNQDFICQMVTDYISTRLGIPSEFTSDIPWPERESLLDAGGIHIGWICGLPYVWKADQESPGIELLVAPVMARPRYQNRPIYFSDVVVHRDSQFFTFADLRGARWAYNEPHSHSGYNITCYQLATLGETSGYFGAVIQAGAHQTALDMILERRIDGSAIDSTVLELELQLRPEIAEQLRIIATWGPSPIPPWVISKSVSQDLRMEFRELLTHMHAEPKGQAILATAQIAHFVRVEDRDYDPIRTMARKAALVKL